VKRDFQMLQTAFGRNEKTEAGRAVLKIRSKTPNIQQGWKPPSLHYMVSVKLNLRDGRTDRQTLWIEFGAF